MEDIEVRKRMRDVLIQEYRELATKLKIKAERIAELDQEIGEATDLTGIIGEPTPLVSSSAAAQIGAVTGARPKLRDDEFTGMTYKDAAKSYLEKVGHAVSMEELLDALRDGGCPVGGVSPKKTLYISLVRGREFKPVPGKSGMLGLRSFYQNRGSDVKGKK
jgi:hypothetical protein